MGGFIGAVSDNNIDTAYTVNWGSSSWRLPSAGSSPEYGYNQTGSEMGTCIT